MLLKSSYLLDVLRIERKQHHVKSRIKRRSNKPNVGQYILIHQVTLRITNEKAYEIFRHTVEAG